MVSLTIFFSGAGVAKQAFAEEEKEAAGAAGRRDEEATLSLAVAAEPRRVLIERSILEGGRGSLRRTEPEVIDRNVADWYLS